MAPTVFVKYKYTYLLQKNDKFMFASMIFLPAVPPLPQSFKEFCLNTLQGFLLLLACI